MNQVFLRKHFSWISALMLVISSPIILDSASAATSDTETIGFTLTGGPMDPGGDESCLPVDYVLSTSLGDAVSDPSYDALAWTSPDININQSPGLGCPGSTEISASSLSISATYFTNGLAVGGESIEGLPNVGCYDEGTLMYPLQTYSEASVTGTCAAATAKAGIYVHIPEGAPTATLYQSTITVVAVL